MSYQDFTPDTAKITDLRLDQANPRIGKKNDQKSCIEAILESKNFINLVNHIAKNGLGLAPIVAYKNASDKKLVVMDGNRRVTALKLLLNPALAKEHNLHSRVVTASDLATKEATLPTNNEIPIFTTTDLNIIHNHMRLTHTGELGGVGQKDWTAMAQALFAMDQGIDDDNMMAASLVVFARDQFGFKFDEEFYVTRLTRLINQDRLKELNLKYENRVINWIKKDGNIEKIIMRIVTDIRDDAISTNDIFTTPQQRDYLDGIFNTFNYTPATNQKITTTQSPNNLGDQDKAPLETTGPNQDLTTKDSPTSKKPTKPTRSGAPKRPSWDRGHVVHRGKHPFDFSDQPDKLSNLYIELSILDLDGKKGTPISAAFAIRAFVELAASYYYRENNLGNENDSLAQKVKRCSQKLSEENKIDEDTHELVIKLANNDNFLSIRSLQKYLHSPHFHPNKQNLNTLWDQIYPFLMECLKPRQLSSLD